MPTPTRCPNVLLYGFASSLLIALSACSYDVPEPVKPASVKPPVTYERARLASAPAMNKHISAEYADAVSHARALSAPIDGQFNADTGREQYQHYPANPVMAAAQNPVSTFSIDVDTGAYANVRRLLNQGQLPQPDAVRLEEMVNYFPYDIVGQNRESPFALSTEVAQTPWNPQSLLLRVAIKAQDRSVAELPPANLVFLVDVSGSMDRREGLPLVQSTLKLLVEQLRAQDRVSLVVYAGNSSVVLAPTSGSDKATIRAAIDGLRAGGSTAGESGIVLAYQQAQKGFIKQGINRILLATDGDFNVGISDFDALKRLAASKRKTGISLTTLGFGTGNYNERLMEQLADAGDGNYAYIDNLREARKVLVDQLSSTLAVVAKDVKIQLEFNPAQVSEYRLLGYENRALQREDFNNDKVDAGEVGAGHSVTALYEVVPVGKRGWLEPLRYQPRATGPAKQAVSDELAMLRLRYKAPGQNTSRLLQVPIAKPAQVAAIATASQDMRFATAVAAFAQQLQGGQYTGQFTFKDSAELARKAKGDDRFGLRAEFIQLVELAQSLQTSTPDLATH
ncbi:vWA domain-containing protein [Pseudomonas sp. S9]|uniref:vWA domain-containing protein n=1 Tax=Pseudomonas sp. S9 TaxID=686578 RepID=UPI0002556770|nr:VWA domain-containing protein [Pseudomonas sp. S9]